jgi:2'-5' RNA ligase
MRTFIGIIAPESVKDVVRKLQKELQEVGVVGKYVERENLHVNLSFLGEISEEESAEIGAKMDMIAKGYKKFVVNLRGVKPIPNLKFVRVVALSVEEGKNFLTSLINDIQKSIGGDAKPAHMTLCRVKGLKNKKRFLENIEKNESTTFASFEVNSIQLIRSELGEEGPRYTVIHESNSFLGVN